MKKWKLVRLAAMPAVAFAGVGSAFAAVPADVTTALETAGTDAVTIATAVLVAIIGIFAIKLLRRAL